MITFDDGYKDYYERAYPILGEYGIPAVNFLATQAIDGAPLWWDQIHLAVNATRKCKVALPWGEGEVIQLDESGRGRLARLAKAHLKAVPDSARQPAFDALLDVLGVNPDTLKSGRQTMTWNEVRASMDMTQYGGHTHTHPILSRLDATGVHAEIRTCRDRILEETGEAPTFFAYPSGYFTREVKDILQQYGFQAAFSTIKGLNGPETDWMELRRIGGPQSVPELAWIVSGFWA
jgi:peptidoglycan/xylan/chitin deacetylase (PgdA/CDA1 family)